MTALVISDARIVNQQKYDEYRLALRSLLERHGARFLAHGQEPEVVQGGWHPPRMSLIEFPSRDAVTALAATDEYQAMQHTLANSAMMDMIVVDGVGPSMYAGTEAAPAYAVADTRIVNRQAFEEYRVSIHAAMRVHRGRYLALTDQITTVAGNWAPPYLTVMEFPDRKAALDAHSASRYQELRDLINNAAMIEMVLLIGGAPG